MRPLEALLLLHYVAKPESLSLHCCLHVQVQGMVSSCRHSCWSWWDWDWISLSQLLQVLVKRATRGRSDQSWSVPAEAYQSGSET
ncbi:hypothetical protein PRUPE_3G027300 [Prunus persica]|uniref:Uncharacterized protein n=1 Tax=Prunus persica TaxID=3760 RepID=A0A251NJI3_PRUPE|nr:hypothetical protein PRUPE_8G120700 [Prunus persica]ONH99457.1 hypothetical protein PRUPE_6G030700 [Prunus persica]ONI15132.1 hypothetical protein PRUPE_3G027300 [Prunus persica]